MTGNMHSKARRCLVFTEILFLLLKSGILLCSAEKITQEPFMVGSDGKEVNLSCIHPSAESSTDSIFWYRQFPNQGPEFVVSGYRGEARSGNLKDVLLLISGDRKSSNLSFARANLEDTAMYYCALSDTVRHPGVFAVQGTMNEGAAFDAGKIRPLKTSVVEGRGSSLDLMDI
uniref:Ig-like domain-containing protein n=1 Tax=Anolis carolinensis TaxID=28377 RepID=A0A803SWL7_ANOCA